jgi:hypothetical protein
MAELRAWLEAAERRAAGAAGRLAALGGPGGASASSAGGGPAAGGAAAGDEAKPFSDEEDDREVIQALFRSIDDDRNGIISAEELAAALATHKDQEQLADLLNTLAGREKELAAGMNMAEFEAVVGKLPRVRGERVRWAASLQLERELARLLRTGDLFDGLAGLKTLKEGAERDGFVDEVCAKFAIVVWRLLHDGLRRLEAHDGASRVEDHINSKFCFDGAYEGQFATLDEFFRGPEALIGVPNPKIMEGMEKEHCSRDNATVRFNSPNYNVWTTPELEWEFVVKPVAGKAYPHTPKNKADWEKPNDWKGEHGREVAALDSFMQLEEVTKAGVIPAEVIGLRLYTGPMFALYNASLRGFPPELVQSLRGNKYETTIFVIASGVTKLSKISAIPPDRRLYRGLGGMVLPRQFWEAFAECQVVFAVQPAGGATPEELAATLSSLVGSGGAKAGGHGKAALEGLTRRLLLSGAAGTVLEGGGRVVKSAAEPGIRPRFRVCSHHHRRHLECSNAFTDVSHTLTIFSSTSFS